MKQWITIIAVLGAVFLFAGCSSNNSQKAPAGTTAPADKNAS